MTSVVLKGGSTEIERGIALNSDAATTDMPLKEAGLPYVLDLTGTNAVRSMDDEELTLGVTSQVFQQDIGRGSIIFVNSLSGIGIEERIRRVHYTLAAPVDFYGSKTIALKWPSESVAVSEPAITRPDWEVNVASHSTLTTDLGSWDQKTALINYLRRLGRIDVANRIQKFIDILDEDPEEPPIVLESLRSLVIFIAQQPNLVPPIVGSDPQGLMELEWHLKDTGDPNSIWGRGNGVVSLKFLESGNIQFVALSGPFREGFKREESQGASRKEEVMESLGAFAPRITIA